MEVQQSTGNADAAAISNSDCSSCSSVTNDDSATSSEEDLPDFDAQLELILTSYPAELVGRYQQKSSAFQHAFVLGHQGEGIAAMKQFGQLPANEQDDLFDFEVGCLMARLGEKPKACDALYSAVQQNPDLLLAAETLVTLLISLEKYPKAIDFIQEVMAKNQEMTFCHAQLAMIYHAMDDADNALNHARKALEGVMRIPALS